MKEKKKILLIGSNGLVGKALQKELNKYPEFEITLYQKSNLKQELKKYYDNIIYCAGDNRSNLESVLNSIEAHNTILSKFLISNNFSHLTYFSSTRIYGEKCTSIKNSININFQDPRIFFNLTKLLGESITQFSKKPICIIRPSNIYGLTTTSPLFLPTITRHAIEKKLVNMFVSPSYSKDYINVKDVAKHTITLMASNKTGTYNLASGKNVTAKDISEVLVKYTDTEIIWHKPITQEQFTPIDISKTQKIIKNYETSSVLEDLKDLIDSFKELQNNK
ncbi:MAG: NAD-dependent epimerase/dehydratase family protein [Bacteriovoracaceae bacterium]|jgi:nucleoside-diphosphate-sugar epimerase|nr:NAD-dependent epimerase/dehydratase family protein [Bacteriovoracaceae bacterium]